MRDESSSDTSQKKALQETELVGIDAVPEPLPCWDWHWQLCLSLAHSPTSTSAILVPVLGRWCLYGSHSCAVPALPAGHQNWHQYPCRGHSSTSTCARLISMPVSVPIPHPSGPTVVSQLHPCTSTITNPPLALYEFLSMMCCDSKRSNIGAPVMQATVPA